MTRELLLVKLSVLGPDHLEDQLSAGLYHQPSRDPDMEILDRETVLAQNFEHSGESSPSAPPQTPVPLTPSEALRLKHQHLHSISVLSAQFGAKIVDISENSVIVEMAGKPGRVEAFLSLVQPFGILESARTGWCSLSLVNGPN